LTPQFADSCCLQGAFFQKLFAAMLFDEEGVHLMYASSMHSLGFLRMTYGAEM
jgi:hypothetical protein